MKKSFVFMLPNDAIENGVLKVMTLKTPSTHSKAVYMLNKEHKNLYEIQAFDEKYRSWLLEGEVVSDGSIRIATPYNPIFLILPYLMKEPKKTPLDHLLYDAEFPDTHILADLVEDLSCVADRIGDKDLNIWCYNEELTLHWLSEKVAKMSKSLQNNHEKTSLTNTLDSDEESYKVLAFEILSENLSAELSACLRVHLKLPEKDKENSSQNDQQINKISSKKQKIDSKLPEKPTAKKAALKQSNKEIALAKSAKGTKSITSFFSKK